ncbi:putative exopolyphosphatase-like protein [Rosellinia necatrix]|uniref:Putative exopolyphosphatase-like protein n=1 Tax=Rosellinia necatrix TaxID=77044 RepID=A0A1W2TED4_ROSNE|nr:putative exopolyphosphatase-like protein [Rosellinia necatrix]
MPPPRTSLKVFLATARAALTAPASKRPVPLTFVVGNESADLDSLCSALLLAYFNTYAPPKKHPLSSSTAGDWTPAAAAPPAVPLHIPVCHLYRADLALRPEFAAVLRDAGVGGEDVLTLEDVLPPPSRPPPAGDKANSITAEAAAAAAAGSLRPEDTRWLLVDHNVMTGRLAASFAARVAGCVDHHADEGAVPPDARPRVIEVAGSCASLVLEHSSDVWAALSSSSSSSSPTPTPTPTPASPGDTNGDAAAEIDAQLARLALAPVLIDTLNLQDGTKTTAHDERAAALAEAKIAAHESGGDSGGGGGGKGERYDRRAFFERISALKDDLSQMSLRDVLRKDYKEWSITAGEEEGGRRRRRRRRLATSSASRGFGYLVDRKAGGDAAVFADALAAWAAERDGAGDGAGVDLLVVLTGFQDARGTFVRELLVWARSAVGAKATRRFEERWADALQLRAWRDGRLDLSVCDGGGGGDGRDGVGWRRCWTQGAVQHSRKQIAPMLRDALQEVSG